MPVSGTTLTSMLLPGLRAAYMGLPLEEPIPDCTYPGGYKLDESGCRRVMRPVTNWNAIFAQQAQMQHQQALAQQLSAQFLYQPQVTTAGTPWPTSWSGVGPAVTGYLGTGILQLAQPQPLGYLSGLGATGVTGVTVDDTSDGMAGTAGTSGDTSG